MDPLQRHQYLSKRRQTAIDKATKPTLYEFSTRRVDSQGLRTGTNAKPPQPAQRDLRGNLIAPDAPREAFANTSIMLGTVSRISDIPLKRKEQEESMDDRQLPKLIRFGGQRTRKKGPITSAKYKFWSALTGVYEDPLFPTPSTENGIGHPSSDLILAIIKFAAIHYASRGQLRPRHNQKIAKSKGPEAGQNPSGPNAPAKQLTKFLTMDRAFDATAAHAIGMIVQELVCETVAQLTCSTIPESHTQRKRKREEPTRYTSPSLTLSKRRAQTPPTSRSAKSKKRRRILRRMKQKSLDGRQPIDAASNMDEAEAEANSLADNETEDVSENDEQDEMDVYMNQ